MAKDRHTREYYVQYAHKHPYWCKASWYLSAKELASLRNENNNSSNNNNKYNIYNNFNL